MFQTNRNPMVLTWQKTRSDCNIMVFKYTIYYSMYQPLAKHFILYSVNHKNKQTALGEAWNYNTNRNNM